MQCKRPIPRESIFFCNQCWADAPVPDAAKIRKSKYIDQIRAGYYFKSDNLIREAVHLLKYEGQNLLAHEMAKRLIPRMPTKFVEADVEWIPVPLHWRRKMVRGFNQSEMIARELALLTGHRMPAKPLLRIRYTSTQTAKTYTDRLANVKGAFDANFADSPPKSVLLIDDVITTGATVEECGRILKENGVEWVGVLAFALGQNF